LVQTAVDVEAVPVTKLLSSEARKVTAAAISSGRPSLPSGTRVASCFSTRPGRRQRGNGRSVGRAGRDGVDPDAAFFESVGPGPDERPDGGLGRRVHAERRIADVRVGGTVEMTEAPLLSSGSAFCTVNSVMSPVTAVAA
jgi:hypothetical protein